MSAMRLFKVCALLLVIGLVGYAMLYSAGGGSHDVPSPP